MKCVPYTQIFHPSNANTNVPTSHAAALQQRPGPGCDSNLYGSFANLINIQSILLEGFEVMMHIEHLSHSLNEGRIY